MRILMIVGACFLALAATTASASASGNWDALADEYLDQAYFKFSPTSGTAAGLHQYDPQLEDYSRSGIDRQIAVLRNFQKRIASVDPHLLNEIAAGDRDILLSNIRGTLLELETIRPWEKNPDIYSSGVTNSIYVIMSRRFASPDERLRSAVAREKQIPAVFGEAKKKSLQSSACLHRSRSRTIARHRELFSIRRSRRLFCRQRSCRQGGICKNQRRGHRRSRAICKLAQIRSTRPLQRRLPHRRRNFFQKTAVRRNGRHAARRSSRNRHGRSS